MALNTRKLFFWQLQAYSFKESRLIIIREPHFGKIYKKSGFDAVKFQKRTIDIVYDKETLDTPRESPWGSSTREQKLGLEFDKFELYVRTYVGQVVMA